MANRALYDGAYALTYISFVLGLATTALRYYSHLVVTKSWGPDDTASVFVLAVMLVQQAMLQVLLSGGCGLPGMTCGIGGYTFYKVIFAEEVVMYSLHFIIKITFLLFFLRIWQSTGYRKFVFVGLGINGAIFLASILLTCLQCNSFQAIFNPGSVPGATCLDQLSVLIIPPVLNIAMDLYILTLPIVVVYNLHLALRRKLQIILVMSFGFVSVIVACVRLSVIPALVKGPNETRQLQEIIIAAVEIQSAVIAMNLPSLKAIWTRGGGGGGGGSGSTGGRATKGSAGVGNGNGTFGSSSTSTRRERGYKKFFSFGTTIGSSSSISKKSTGLDNSDYQLTALSPVKSSYLQGQQHGNGQTVAIRALADTDIDDLAYGTNNDHNRVQHDQLYALEEGAGVNDGAVVGYNHGGGGGATATATIIPHSESQEQLFQKVREESLSSAGMDIKENMNRNGTRNEVMSNNNSNKSPDSSNFGPAWPLMSSSRRVGDINGEIPQQQHSTSRPPGYGIQVTRHFEITSGVVTPTGGKERSMVQNNSTERGRGL